MKPVFQTRFGDPEGNCLMAAVASILGVPLDDCPDLYEHEKRDRNWWLTLERWLLRDHHFAPIWCVEYVPAGYSVISGNSPRGLRHSCVALDGKLVHDPHPEGAGLVEGSVRGYITLVPVVPGLSVPAPETGDQSLTEPTTRETERP